MHAVSLAVQPTSIAVAAASAASAWAVVHIALLSNVYEI